MELNKTMQILQYVKYCNGIKAISIASDLNLSINDVSSRLTNLKNRKMITNENGKWYRYGYLEHKMFKKITEYLNDVNDKLKFDKSWSEGFVVGCHFNGLFGDDVMEQLLKWIGDK